MHSNNDKSDLGSNEFYSNKIKKGFEIINEVVYENDLLMTDILDDNNNDSTFRLGFDVVYAGRDKQLVI